MPKNKNEILKTIFLWLPVVIWATIIFTFSSYPTVSTSKFFWKDFIAKKLAHIFVYGVLSLLVYRAFLNSNYSKKEAAKLAIIISFIYGLTDEIHQSFTPGRSPRAYDVIFDTIGASLSIYLIWKLLPKAPKKLKRLAKKLQLTL